jgi:hypothetical protein
MIKGLVVDSSKHFVLKENLTSPLVGQDEVLVKVKSASINPFDAQSAHGRFDAYFAAHEVVKEVQSGLVGTPYDVFDGGKIRSVKPMTEWKHVDFKNGFSTSTYRFDTPDQLTLPILSNANSVSAHIAYNDKYTVGFLSFMVRSRFWRLINRPMFKKFRHSLLYNPGEGGPPRNSGDGYR